MNINSAGELELFFSSLRVIGIVVEFLLRFFHPFTNNLYAYKALSRDGIMYLYGGRERANEREKSMEVNLLNGSNVDGCVCELFFISVKYGRYSNV